MNDFSALRALLGNQPLFTLSNAGSEAFRVVRFSAHEGLSSLFEVRVELAGPEADLSAIVDTPMSLQIAGIDSPRYLSGICASFEYVGHTRNLQLYEAQIVPRLWRLQFRRNSRIFQDQSTPDIVRAVLKDAGMASSAYRFALVETYAPRNYCVQYQEDDLTFLCRLLEEDGIFFFFEHDRDAETVVFADHSRAHPPISGDSTLWFVPPGGGVPDREHVRSFRFGERIRPGAVTLRDFNLHKPSEPMEVRKLGDRHTDLEIYTYPGEYQDPGRSGSHQGQQLAKLRLEAHQATRRIGSATSDSPRVSAGHSMAIVGHSRVELDTQYRVLQVEHHGQQPQVLDMDAAGAFRYDNSFTVSELSVPFRPLQSTPRPVMRGLQTATVVGPAGEEVHTDEHGRVKVQFHWDRSGSFNESSSCWVRVSQSSAGNGWGAMFIPRIGHEVLIDFIEGDPDRPVVTGGVYTGENRPPFSLPEGKTRTGIRSDSSPGGGGFNELRFEDAKGGEQIFLHAQHDFDEVVGNNHTEDVGCNETITIGANQDTTVGGNRSMHVSGSFTETVNGTETRTVTGAVTATFAASETRSVAADQTEDIGGCVTRTIAGSVTENITGSVSQTITGSATECVIGSLAQTITGGVSIVTPETYNVTALGGMNVIAPGGINMIAPAGFLVIAPGGARIIDPDYCNVSTKSSLFSASEMGITGFKFEGVGLGIELAALKLDAVGALLEFTAWTNKKDVTNTEIHITSIVACSIEINMAGFFVLA